MKKIAIQQKVCVQGPRTPFPNSTATAISIQPDMPYVPTIIGLRPTVSNRRPSTKGPKKFPAASGRMYMPIRELCT